MMDNNPGWLNAWDSVAGACSIKIVMISIDHMRVGFEIKLKYEGPKNSNLK